MSRAWKRLKKYERWVLITVTLILLATFSITGISARGCGTSAPGATDHGGVYEPVPGRRVTVTDREFQDVYRRYIPIYKQQGWGPSIRYAPELASTQSRHRIDFRHATWVHLATVGAAEAAGYRVGPEELRHAVETLVLRAWAQRPEGDPRLTGLRFSVEIYDQVVTRLYQGTKGDFEKTVREIVLKDKYLEALVEGQRLAVGREGAFDRWKSSRERVDLQFAAVPAAPFREMVELEETTRGAVAATMEGVDRFVAASMEVQRLSAVVKAWKAQNGGALPADATELATKEPGQRSLGGTMPKDPWGNAFAYEKTGEDGRIASPGPDGQLGTADDVGPEALAVLQTLGALRRTGDALVARLGQTKAWPAALAELTQAAPSAPDKPAFSPLLPEVPKDAWGKDLVWEASGPTLLSAGPDGARGTADDLAATVAEAGAGVPAPPALTPWTGSAKDAWDRPLAVALAKANPYAFEARSAGPDGQAGSADDVVDGNATDLRTFFGRAKYDFRLPLRLEVEAVYVIPALVPDAVFAEAWKRFPQHRPEERDAWDLFRSTAFYEAQEGEGPDAKPIDAADPAKGYAAALIASLREKDALPKDGTVWQVPSTDALGERKDPPAAGAGGLPSPAGDPLYRTYLEQHWRPVVLRDLFFERWLAALLTDARAAADARKKWDLGGRAGAEPALVSFVERMASWKDLQPSEADSAKGARFLQYWATEAGKPVDRTALEQHPDFGDYTLPFTLKDLKDGEYPPIPTVLRNGALRSAWRVVQRHEARDPELEEVREKIWPLYVDARSLARAVRELTAARAEVEKAVAALPADSKPEDRVAAFARLVAETLGQRGVSHAIDRTGMYLTEAGAIPPLAVPADASPEQQLAMHRRDWIRRNGYDEVRVLGSRQGVQALEVGQLGRRILEDDRTGKDSTRCAYLVQVADHAFPSPEEFTGAAYLDWLRDQSYDQRPWETPEKRAQDRGGAMVQVLARAYEDWESARSDFAIRTNTEFEIPREALEGN